MENTTTKNETITKHKEPNNAYKIQNIKLDNKISKKNCIINFIEKIRNVDSASTADEASKHHWNEKSDTKKKQKQYIERVNSFIKNRTFLQSDFKIKQNLEINSKIPLKTKIIMNSLKRTILMSTKLSYSHRNKIKGNFRTYNTCTYI